MTVPVHVLAAVRSIPHPRQEPDMSTPHPRPAGPVPATAGTAVSGVLRRLADWIDAHLAASAGRLHSSELDGIQYRDRDMLHLAVGPVAVLIDLPKRWTRPRKPGRPVADKPIGLNPDFFKGGAR